MANGQRGLNGEIAALPAEVERELVHEPARIPSQKMAGKTVKDHLKIPESVGRTHVVIKFVNSTYIVLTVLSRGN